MLCVCGQILKIICGRLDTLWSVGLVAWFSLRVREVPGTTPGETLSLNFCVVSTGNFYYSYLKNKARFSFFLSMFCPSLFSNCNRGNIAGKNF